MLRVGNAARDAQYSSTRCPEVRLGSIASLWQRARHFRSTLNSGHAAAPRWL